jgi:hypothetical protein
MDSVIVITDEQFAFDEMLQHLETNGLQISKTSKSYAVVSDETNHVYVEKQDATLLQHYNSDELQKIKETLARPQFFSLSYRSVALLQTVLHIIAENYDCLIDNDKGLLENRSEWLTHLKISL